MQPSSSPPGFRRFIRGTALGLAVGAALAAVPASRAWALGSAGFIEWLSASYAQAPALVLGLVVLITLPLLALLGLWARRREAATTAISEAQTQVRRVARAPVTEPREGVRTGHIPLRPQEAWIEIVNASEVAPTAADTKYSLARSLLRIGREQDNDVCLEDVTVHRYHAAIHRTEDAEFVVTDLSSAGGNGVIVNGRSVSEARLVNGDVIELGHARLRFAAGRSG